MAVNNTTTVKLAFQADTSSAKASIIELKKSLLDIQNLDLKKINIDADLNNAAKAAQTLFNVLEGSVDKVSGKLNFSAFTKQIAQSKTSVTELSTSLLNAGASGQAAFNNLITAIARSDTQLKQVNKTIANIGTTLKNTIKWEASSNLIHGLESAFSSAISYATNLNKTLTDIRVVTGASMDDMSKFTKQANTMAKQLGATTQDIAKAALIYYQQGDNAQLAAEKAAITTKAANVAFTASAQEMSEMLTAVWNSYKVGQNELQSVVDIVTALGATTASSTEEIMTAMQRVAATANTVGVSVKQMSSIIATAASVTRQSPETIGTAWNTMLARFGSLKLGETLEDGVDLTKYTKAIQSVGVNVLDANNQLRNMGDIINDIGEKWQTMTATQKAALAQTVGGARQYTQMIAFFDAFDQYKKNLDTANNSKGSLDQQNNIYLESYKAQAKTLQASLEDLYSSLLNGQGLAKIQTVLGGITESVTGMVKGFGGLTGILSTVSNLMLTTFSAQIQTRISNFGKEVIQKIPQKFSDWKERTMNQNGLTKQDSLAIKQYNEILSIINSRKTAETDNLPLQKTLELNAQLIEQKKQLIENSSQYTAAQLESSKVNLDNISKEIEKITQLKQAYDNFEATSKQNIAAAQSSIFEGVNGKEAANRASRKQKIDYANTQAKTYMETSEGNVFTKIDSGITKDTENLSQRMLEVYKNTSVAAEGIELFKNGLNSLVTSSSSTNEQIQILEREQSNFNMLMEQTKMNSGNLAQDIQKVSQAYQTYIDVLKGTNTSTNAKDALDALHKALISLMNAIAQSKGDMNDAFDEMNVSGTALDNIEASAQDAAKAFRLFGTQADTAGQKIKDFNDKANQGSKWDKFAESLTKIGSSVTAVVSGFSGMSNLWANFDSMSNLQKVTGSLSQLENLLMSKDLPTLALKAGGMLAGAIFGEIEKKQQEYLKKLQEDLQNLTSNNQKILEDSSDYDGLISSFNTLYENKLNNLQVDGQLKSAAEDLGITYGLLSGTTEDLIGKQRELAETIRTVLQAELDEKNANARAVFNDAQDLGTRTNYGGQQTEFRLHQLNFNSKEVLNDSIRDSLVQAAIHLFDTYLTDEQKQGIKLEKTADGSSAIITNEDLANIFNYASKNSGEDNIANTSNFLDLVKNGQFIAIALGSGNASIPEILQLSPSMLNKQYGRFFLKKDNFQPILPGEYNNTWQNSILSDINYAKYTLGSTQPVSFSMIQEDLPEGYNGFNNGDLIGRRLISEAETRTKGKHVVKDEELSIADILRQSGLNQYLKLDGQGNWQLLASDKDEGYYKDNLVTTIGKTLQLLSEYNLKDNSIFETLSNIQQPLLEWQKEYSGSLKSGAAAAARAEVNQQFGGETTKSINYEEYNKRMKKIDIESILGQFNITKDSSNYNELYDYVLQSISGSLTNFASYDAVNKIIDEYSKNNNKSSNEVEQVKDRIYKLMDEKGYIIDNFTYEMIDALFQNSAETALENIKYQQELSGQITSTETKSNALINAQKLYKKNMTPADWENLRTSLNWEDYGTTFLDFMDLAKDWNAGYQWFIDQQISELQKMEDFYTEQIKTFENEAKQQQFSQNTEYIDNVFEDFDQLLNQSSEDLSAITGKIYNQNIVNTLKTLYTSLLDEKSKQRFVNAILNRDFTTMESLAGESISKNNLYLQYKTDYSKVAAANEAAQAAREQLAVVQASKAALQNTSSRGGLEKQLGVLTSSFNAKPQDETSLNALLTELNEGLSENEQYSPAQIVNSSLLDYQKIILSNLNRRTQLAQGSDDYNEALQSLMVQQIKQLEEQYNINMTASELKPKQSTFKTLQEGYQNLSSIDILALPEAGTEAYNTLAAAIDAAGISMEKFSKMSMSDKISEYFNLLRANIDAEISNLDEQIKLFEKNFGWEEGADNVVSPELEQTYTQYLQLLKDRKDLQSQLTNLALQESQTRVKAANEETAANSKQAEAMQKKYEKQKEQLDIFSNSIRTGNIDAIDRLKLNPEDLKDWETLTTIQERAAWTANKWSENIQTGRDAYEKSKETIDNVVNIWDDVDLEKSLGLQDFVKLLQDKGYNEEIQNILLEAYNNVKDKYTDDEFSKLSGRELQQAISDELVTIQDTTTQTWSSILQTMTQAMMQVYKDLSEAEKAAAQESVDTWTQAFETIANAKEKLYKKESLLEDLSDPQKLRDITDAYNRGTGENISVAEFYNRYLQGEVSGDDLKQLSYDSAAQKNLAKLNLLQQGLNPLTNKFNYKNMAEQVAQQRNQKYEGDNKTNIDSYLQTELFEFLQSNAGTLNDDLKNAIISNLMTENESIIPEIGKSAQEFIVSLMDSVEQSIDISNQAKERRDNINSIIQKRDAEIAELEMAQQEAATQSSNYAAYSDIAHQIFMNRDGDKTRESFLNGVSEQTFLQEVGNLGPEYEYTDLDQIPILVFTKIAQMFDQMSINAGQFYETEEGNLAIEAAKQAIMQKAVNELIAEYGEDAPDIQSYIQELAAQGKNVQTEEETRRVSEENIENEKLSEYANYAGVSENELKELAKAFDDLDQSTKILDEDTKEYRIALYEATALAHRASEGAKAIGEHYKKNKKEIEDLTKATEELTDKQKATVDTMKENLSKAFNVEKKYLSDKFIKDHIDDYKELAKGSEDAAKRIQKALSAEIGKGISKEKFSIPLEIDVSDGIQDGLSTATDLIDSFVDKYQNQPIGFNVDSGPFIDALNSMLAAGQVTTDQIQAYFNSLGWNPEITYDWHELRGTGNLTGKTEYTYFDEAEKKLKTVSATHKGIKIDNNMIGIPRIGNAGVSKVSSTQHVASKAASGGSGGGGGGGGGGSKPKHKEYKGDEEIERYHQINRQIEYQERLLKRVNLLKQQRYGLGYLRALEQENAELMKHIELVQRRAGPGQAGYWLEQAKQTMAQFGATYDSTGQLNYRPYMFNILDFYNQGVDQYNAMVDSGVPEEEAQEWFDKNIQKVYDEAKEAISIYEEAMDYQLDSIEMTMEDLNKISANLKEMAVYKMKFEIELDEHDIKRLDFIIKRYDDYLDKQAESEDLLMKNIDLVMKDLDYTGQAFDDLFKWYHIKVKVFDENSKWFQSMTSMEEDLKKQTQSFLNDADYVGGLQEVAAAIMENLEKLEEYRKQMLEVYGHTIELAADKLENFTNTLEHHITMYDGYLEILDLISDGHEHYLEDIQLLNGAYTSSLTEIAVIREHLNVLLDQREKLLTQMEDPIYASNEKIQKDFEALEERIEELEEQLLDATQTTLDKAKAMLDKAIESAVDKMSKLTNIQGTDVEWLSTQWDWWKEEQDQYVDRITQVYEVDKLVRDIEKSIADTRNKNNQAQLKALEDEIQLRSKNNALNEYSIEMMRLSYELLLAQQNLENANDSKDTVRLTRDDNGNYIYQYTADEDKITEAQQKYNDVLYEMNQTTKERYRDLVQSGIDVRREELEQFQKIMDDTELSAEEKMERMQQIYEHYGNMLEGIDIFMDEVLQNMGENQLAWTNNMNENLIETSGTSKEQLTNLSNGARTQLNSMYNDTRLSAEEWKKGTQEQIEGVGKALKNYENQLLEVQKTSDITLQTMIKQITEYGKQATTVNDQASILAKTMQDVLDKLVKMNEQWISMDQKLQKVIDQYLKMHELIGKEEDEVAHKEYEVNVEEVPLTPDEQKYYYQTGQLPGGGKAGTNAQGQATKQRFAVTDPVTGVVLAIFDSEEKANNWINDQKNGQTARAITTPYNEDDKNVQTSKNLQQQNKPPAGPHSTKTCSNCASGCYNDCGSACENDCKYGCKNTCKNKCTGSCVEGCQNWCKHDTAMQVDGKVHKLKTGGLNDYTGLAWLDGTPQKPEYVLNAEQTHEMFGILNDHTIYRLIDTMTAATQAMLSAMGLHAGSISTQSLVNSTNAPMTTYITAEFPNATDHNEIELALQNLVNNTAQSINRFMN